MKKNQPSLSADCGLVFDIQRFSTHDGPGIRTTVFTKGCPLSCLWCQNPEGIELKRNLSYFKNKCIACGTCIGVCPEKAITFVSGNKKDGIAVDKAKCTQCGECVGVCPSMALAFDSKYMTVKQVMDEVVKDTAFFGDFGGVTLSGGDPFYQWEFTLAVLKACKAANLRTAIETSLYASPQILDLFLPYLDLLIADMKVFDAEKHLRYTGKDNELIKENFRFLDAFLRSGKTMPQILVRIPMIPGYTATEDNIRSVAEFIHTLSPKIQMELLNYNPLAKSKYNLLGQPYLFTKNPKMYPPEEMDRFYRILAEAGIVNVVHG